MSEEAVTTSWFSRIGDSIKGVFFGIALVLVASILLWWNEGRSVRRYKEISFAKENVVEAKLDSVDASLEGKLVHFAGPAATKDVLTDENFGVQVKDSFSMSSTVEMYQWKEVEHREAGKTKKNVGGSTTKEPDKVTYTYEKTWSSSINKSDSFKQKVDPQTNTQRINPEKMPYDAKRYSATNVTVGAYTLPAGKASGLGSSVKLDVNYDQVKIALPKTAIVADGIIYFNVYGEQNYNVALGNVANATTATPTVSVASEAAQTQPVNPEQPVVVNVQNQVNIAQYQVNPANPKVGDVRITYKYAPVCDVTVIAKQVGSSVDTYKIDSDLSYIDIRNGKLEAKDVFASNEQSEGMLVWLLRIAGFIVMAVAFGMIFRPLSVLADVLPFLGNIAEVGCGIIGNLCAAFLSLMIIALAWLFYRPVLAIVLFLLMGAAAYGIYALITKVKEAKNAAPAAETTAESAPAAE